MALDDIEKESVPKYFQRQRIADHIYSAILYLEPEFEGSWRVLWSRTRPMMCGN